MTSIRYMTAETAGEDAVRLAKARQQIAADRTHLPTWDELTDDERDQSTVAAGWWLEAAKDAGLVQRQDWPPATLVASLRLEWSSIRSALDPALHTPARAVAYLTANGWAKESDRHGGAVWQNAELERSAFVPMETSFVDWDRRMAELVHDLADAYGTGEIAILAAIANETEES